MIFTVYTLVVFVSKEGICYICISLRPRYAKAERRCRHKLQRVSGGRRGASVHDGITIPIDLLILRVTTAEKQRLFHFPHERGCFMLLFSAKEERVRHNHCFSFLVTFCSTDCRCGATSWVTRTELPKVVVVPKVVVDAPHVAGAAVVPKVGAVPNAGAAPNTAVPKAVGAASVGGAPKVEEEKENTGGLVVVVADALPRVVVVVLLPLVFVVVVVPATCTYVPRI